MRSIASWVKDHLKIIKGLFVFSVCVIVIVELSGLLKSISFSQLGDIFGGISFIQLSIMVVVGLLAIVPMLFYDIILNKLLSTDFSMPYIIKTSWLINTMNNLTGFGGVVSIGLRSQLFGKKSDTKKMLKSISLILFFSMSGISLCCLIAFIIQRFTVPFISFEAYWIWLLGGSLYFPIVSFVSYRKKEAISDELTGKKIVGLLLSSFLEWSGSFLVFFTIGNVMGWHFSASGLFILFMSASIIGIVSMIPGSIGSFDMIMIIGLGTLGIDKEFALVWLLLYRLFYYLIPFGLGLIFSAKSVGNVINEKFDGIPKILFGSLSHFLLSFGMFFLGVFLILSGTIPDAIGVLHLPIMVSHILNQIPSTVLGFLLLAVGRAVYEKVTKAYIPAVILMIASLLFVFWQDFSWATILLFAIVLLLLIMSRDTFYRDKLVYSWGALFLDRTFYVLITFLFFIMTIYNLPTTHMHFRHAPEFILFPSGKTWFTGLIIISIMFVLMYLLYRYFSKTDKTIGVPYTSKRLNDLLEKFGGNETSHLACTGDKLVYYYQSDNGEDLLAFLFQIYADKCVVMGDVFGDLSYRKAAFSKFIDDADLLGYSVVFYEIKEDSVMELHELGFDFIKMGEEALVSLDTFTISGKKFRGERTIMNRFAKENFIFEVIQPPYTTTLLDELKEISDNWLEGQKEKAFSVGFFSDSYLSSAPIAIVKDEHGKIWAFANIMLTYTNKQATIDMMRYRHDSPSGVMDYLFISLFDYYNDEKIQFFNLGMAPLANVGKSNRSFIQERIAHYVFEYGTRFYSFQGLRKFKEKYVSEWVPKYMSYPKSSGLLFTLLQIMMIINRPKNVSNNKEFIELLNENE